jgi:hypothetical protein
MERSVTQQPVRANLEGGFMAPDLQRELRDFMGETRHSLQELSREMHGSLSSINDKLSDIREHSVKQNGSIALVMDRERETYRKAESACEKANAALDTIGRLEGRIDLVQQLGEAEREVAKERHEDVSDEVVWVRDNFWKLALGGVSLLTIGQKVIDLFQSINTP